MKEVKVYSTLACPYCRMAKDYLKSNGVQYQDIDVSSDPEVSREMILLSGQMGVPVVVIDSEVILGFNKSKINPLLGIE